MSRKPPLYARIIHDSCVFCKNSHIEGDVNMIYCNKYNVYVAFDGICNVYKRAEIKGTN